ncbi:MAG TPA: hypothetical protein VG602_04720 [Actinomycetota bacterium]|nr:hypothetical protein [Actinomycetota bacterium]
MLAKAPGTTRRRPRTRWLNLAAAALVVTFALAAPAAAARPDKVNDPGPPPHSNAGGSKAEATTGTSSTAPTTSSTSSTSTPTTFAKPAAPGGGGGGGGGAGGGGGGSTGTVKIKTLGGTETRSNEPHRGCVFFIEFWNFAGPGAVTATLDLITPTEGGVTGGSGTLDPDGADGSHDATIELNLLNVPDIASVTPHRTGGEPGYHVNVSTTTPTGDQKTKTIWARNCPITTTTPPPTGIDVTKTCPARASTGDRINYRITVRNSGQEALNTVVVTDTLLGTLSFPTSLTVGQSVTQTVSRTILQSDPDPLVNTVTATAVGATTATAVTDTANCTTDIEPLVKGGDFQPSPPREPGPPPEEPEVLGGPPLEAGEPAEAGLAFTGYWAVPLAFIALGMLVTGSGLLAAGRRRERSARNEDSPAA